jgi:hypothetical protein
LKKNWNKKNVSANKRKDRVDQKLSIAIGSDDFKRSSAIAAPPSKKHSSKSRHREKGIKNFNHHSRDAIAICPKGIASRRPLGQALSF